ncbi:MAG: methylated-DNA--[protein]-cysteine S-methyltransferase [Anaerolineales bacterium]
MKSKQVDKYTGRQVNKYTRWMDSGGEAPDKLTRVLDELYASGPGARAQQAAESALQSALSKRLGTVHYDLLESSPLGRIWIAAGPRGLVAVEYNGSEENFRAYLRKLTRQPARRSAERVAEAKKMVLDYLSGKRDRLELDVDLSGITPFQRAVLEATRKVPRGQVSTYGEIARRIGNPKAVRAVGQALRRNPIPIVVPCHRVIASDGTLGGYAGNMRDRRKVELLRLEGVVLA